jgi:hypothetical protein
LGNLVNIFLGSAVEGGIGLTIAGALLLHLLRADVRCAFSGGAQTEPRANRLG